MLDWSICTVNMDIIRYIHVQIFSSNEIKKEIGWYGEDSKNKLR